MTSIYYKNWIGKDEGLRGLPALFHLTDRQSFLSVKDTRSYIRL